MRLVQQLDRDLVGGGFLHAAEGVELRLRHALAAHQDQHAGFAGAGRDRCNADHHRQQHRDHRLLDRRACRATR